MKKRIVAGTIAICAAGMLATLTIVKYDHISFYCSGRLKNIRHLEQSSLGTGDFEFLNKGIVLDGLSLPFELEEIRTILDRNPIGAEFVLKDGTRIFVARPSLGVTTSEDLALRQLAYEISSADFKWAMSKEDLAEFIGLLDLKEDCWRSELLEVAHVRNTHAALLVSIGKESIDIEWTTIPAQWNGTVRLALDKNASEKEGATLRSRLLRFGVLTAPEGTFDEDLSTITRIVSER